MIPPSTVVNHWLQKKGTKGTVVVLVVDHWLTIAHVAHEFFMDFCVKLKLS